MAVPASRRRGEFPRASPIRGPGGAAVPAVRQAPESDRVSQILMVWLLIVFLCHTYSVFIYVAQIGESD